MSESQLDPESREKVDRAWEQLDLDSALAARSHPGAAGVESVKRQLSKAAELLSGNA
jgi:hypothetical protein